MHTPQSSVITLRSISGIATGLLLAMTAFLGFVFLVGLALSMSDRQVIDQKTKTAISAGDIQVPGRWDVSDSRGIDTFTDCLVLQSAKLASYSFLYDLFVTNTYTNNIGDASKKTHPCDVLSSSYAEDHSTFHPAIRDYSRYWWGSASLARLVLGFSSLSLGQYRQIIFLSLIAALVLFTATFAIAYKRAILFFLPYLACVVLGFSLLSLGRSISQAPEEIVGLLVLSAYNLMHVERQCLLARSFFYTFLGALCVYFDLLNGVAVLVVSIVCCQWTASAIITHLKLGEDANDSWVKCVSGIATNLALIVTGAAFSIIVRLIGYSYATDNSLLDTIDKWRDNLTLRIDGNLVDTGQTDTLPTIFALFLQLKEHRLYPFYGILSKHEADIFYAIGMLGWLLLVPICVRMARRHALPRGVLAGFVLAGLCVPVWFLVFKQHSIVHVWMTGRILVLFCSLGITSAFTMYVLSKDAPRFIKFFKR